MRFRQTQAQWRAIYEQFMHSRAWREKRAAVMERANGRCEACLRAPASSVHHVVYPRARNGAVSLVDFEQQPCWQLRACCFTCHAAIHGREPMEQSA